MMDGWMDITPDIWRPKFTYSVLPIVRNVITQIHTRQDTLIRSGDHHDQDIFSVPRIPPYLPPVMDGWMDITPDIWRPKFTYSMLLHTGYVVLCRCVTRQNIFSRKKLLITSSDASDLPASRRYLLNTGTRYPGSPPSRKHACSSRSKRSRWTE